MGTGRVLDCGSGTPDYHPRGHTGWIQPPGLTLRLGSIAPPFSYITPSFNSPEFISQSSSLVNEVSPGDCLGKSIVLWSQLSDWRLNVWPGGSPLAYWIWIYPGIIWELKRNESVVP
jgi:hypothetical protein